MLCLGMMAWGRDDSIAVGGVRDALGRGKTGRRDMGEGLTSRPLAGPDAQTLPYTQYKRT
jgi:hypothetical protein